MLGSKRFKILEKRKEELKFSNPRMRINPLIILEPWSAWDDARNFENS